MSARAAKEDELVKTAELLRRYPTVALASLEKVRAAQLQELRGRFRGQMVMKVLKNTLAKRALENANKGMGKLAAHLEGSNVMLFATQDAFRLAKLLDQSKVKTVARAGDVSPADIVVPSGNTGLPPGPVISEFTEVGIQTRIESGSVWVSRDTVVVKRGEAISPKVAAVLSRLGIKPVEAGLSIKAVCSGNLVMTQEQLRLDLDAVRASFQRAYGNAVTLAVSAAYTTRETVPVILVKAFREAYAVGMQAAYPAPRLIKDLVLYAQAQAVRLNELLGGGRKPQEQSPEERKVEKEEGPKAGEPEKTEDVGLAALFG